jgi:hypothetical protein
MNRSGTALATRYSYPPNSFALCGPERQADLSWYARNQKPDLGTEEIIAQFATLYPYLLLIAGENGRKNPFDSRIVEAYWIGNNLLAAVTPRQFVRHLDETLQLKRKLNSKNRDVLFQKVARGGLPHHAFHVLNVPTRTGHLPIPHTIATMDACLVNWGRVTEVRPRRLVVRTSPLILNKEKLAFGPPVRREVKAQGSGDVIFQTLRVGDWVSYHWGYVCEKLTLMKRRNLATYTHLALAFANTHP